MNNIGKVFALTFKNIANIFLIFFNYQHLSSANQLAISREVCFIDKSQTLVVSNVFFNFYKIKRPKGI